MDVIQVVSYKSFNVRPALRIQSELTIKVILSITIQRKAAFGVKIELQLLFESHIFTLWKKANLKLHALSSIANYMDFEKWKYLMKIFIASQFNYYHTLIWMFQKTVKPTS